MDCSLISFLFEFYAILVVLFSNLLIAFHHINFPIIERILKHQAKSEQPNNHINTLKVRCSMIKIYGENGETYYYTTYFYRFGISFVTKIGVVSDMVIHIFLFV